MKLLQTSFELRLTVPTDLQLRQEKCELEVTLEKEQEYQVNKLMRRIEKLQGEVVSKQATLEQVGSKHCLLNSLVDTDWKKT